KTRLSHLDLSAVRGGPPACPLRAGLLHPVVASSGQVSNGRYWREADVGRGRRKGSHTSASRAACHSVRALSGRGFSSLEVTISESSGTCASYSGSSRLAGTGGRQPPPRSRQHREAGKPT